MKITSIFTLLFLTISISASAQRSGLINSGDLLTKGAALHDSAEYKQALALYDKISRSDTNYVRTVYEKALTCLADSQFRKTIQYCKEGLALKEDRGFEPDLIALYGSAHTDLKEYDEAIKIFDRGIAKYPAAAGIYFNKGLALLEKGDLTGAEKVFQQTLLMSPYMYSAHYQLALTAYKQGKIVPAFLSTIGYLLMTPQGRYFSKSINLLDQISKGTDEVLALKNKRTQAQDAAYQTVEEILLSKIALDKQYKPIIQLDDNISRQMQVVFEKMEYDAGSKDFWVQYYLPYYKQVFNSGKLELFVNHAFSNVNVKAVQDYNKKNKKAIDAFITEAAEYFNPIRATRQLNFNSRDTVTRRYIFEDGKMIGRGQLINKGETLVGPWEFLYSSGNLKGKGLYDQAGGREGDWKFYYFDGTPKSVEHYAAGKQDGMQEFYHENGNLSSREPYVNGQAEGLITTYYPGGAKKMEVYYKAGKKDGIQKVFYASGKLSSISTYANGQLNGLAKEYYDTGALKNEGNYVNDMDEGPYRSYYKNGKPATEMVFVKGKVEGEWKSYHDNGQLKEKYIDVAGVMEGPYQEFYDNGQLKESYITKKGKVDGDALNYGPDGKLFATYGYDNGVIRSVKFQDPAGKQLYASALKGDRIDIMAYTAEGLKKSHFSVDKKGELSGPDTTFYTSGQIYQTMNYKEGKLNGILTTYHLNGKKKSEINMTDDDEDGYYLGYHINGQPEAEGWMVAGNNQGEWVYYDEAGKLSAKRYYLNSELHGYRESYRPDGKKITEEKYNNGLLERMTQYDANGKILADNEFPKGEGKYTLLYPNGKIKAQGNFTKGNLNGAYKTFYFDGSTESSMFYKDGQIDSTYSSFYYGGGKHSERTYAVGSKEGTWKTFTEDGKLYCVLNYANDEASGEHVYYNSNGSKDIVYAYKNNDLNGPTVKYDVEGALAYRSMFEDDLLKSYTYFDKDGKMLPLIAVTPVNGQFRSLYANGRPSREGNYIGGERHGRVATYYANGQIRTEDFAEYGVNNGVSKEWHPNGKLMTETPRQDTNLQGIVKEYYATGAIKKEVPYVNGYTHGVAKYYNETGKVVKTMTYDYDDLTAATNEK